MINPCIWFCLYSRSVIFANDDFNKKYKIARKVFVKILDKVQAYNIWKMQVMRETNFILIILKNLGLNIRAFVRDESKVPTNLKDKIEIVVGDVTNAEQVSNAISNRDAVVVVLGTRNDLGKYSILYEILIFQPTIWA